MTFGPSSSLERIGDEAFRAVVDEEDSDEEFVGMEHIELSPRALVEITIPDGVRELGDGCFRGCSSLHRVTFGPSSSLEQICFHEFPRIWAGLTRMLDKYVNLVLSN